MSKEKIKEIETEISDILALLPTDQKLIIAMRYEGGLLALKTPIAEVRQRLENLQTKFKEKSQ